MRVTSTWQLSLVVAASGAIGVLVGYLIAPAQEPQIARLQELVNQFRRELEQKAHEEQEGLRALERAAEEELRRELLRRFQSESGSDGSSSPD